MLTNKSVYVINKHGKPLMPTTPPNARVLLRQGKARVVKRAPFTIQLLHGSSGYRQPITLGVDSGYEHIGLSATTDSNSGYEHIGLSAVVEKPVALPTVIEKHIGLSATDNNDSDATGAPNIRAEVFASQIDLRKDVSKLITERRMYRRNRRNRKTRYRKARFLNRIRNKRRDKRIKRKRDVWLAPSIQHKLDSHIRLVQKAMKLLPITRIVVEVANFDIQQLKADLEGSGKLRGNDYQHGEQLGYDNVRAYILHRDSHTCQHCRGHSKNKFLEVHHIVKRSQGGSDRPDNLITLCETCHDALHRGDSHQEHHRVGLKLKVKPSRGFRAETFMSTVRRMIVGKLRRLLPNISVEETYGYVTKSNREALGLPKSHINDAFAMSYSSNVSATPDINGQYIRSGVQYLVKQVRKQNRKLFKGKRSETVNKGPRYMFGFQRYDKVKFLGKEYFILGRRVRGAFKLGKLDGTVLKTEPNYKKLKLLESFQTVLWETQTCSV